MPDCTGNTDLYLSDISERDKPWDKHRAITTQISSLYDGSEFQRLADRMQECSRLLGFIFEAQDSGEFKLRLQQARFCRVRHCPTCQWRKSMKWKARFLQAIPAITETYPTARWLFLTLTVRNPPVEDLRATLQHMNKSWVRLTQRKRFPAFGFIKATEVTRAKDGYAHPHFHCLLLVPSSYFSTGYINKSDWQKLWGEALRVRYEPVVDIQVVKPKKHHKAETPVEAIVPEILKYTIKPEDLVHDAGWLHEVTRQLHQTRSVSVGGVLREFLSDDEPDDLVHIDDDAGDSLDGFEIYFGWREKVKRYAKTEP